MSVDDRLREGLARNAEAFQPDVERRLAAVIGRGHRRQRFMVVGAVAVGVALIVAALISFGVHGTGLPDRNDVNPASASPSTSSLKATIPDGRYSTVVRRDEEIRKGFSAAAVREQLGADGKLLVTIEMAAPLYRIQVTGDNGQIQLGDFGSASYDSDGLLVTTSHSTGCMACSVFYRWTFNGTSLTLKMVKRVNDPTVGEDERIISEHVFRKVS